MSPAWALPLLIAMQTRSASVSPRPVAWAVQSPRPALCVSTSRLWDVSRQAQVEQQCRELGRAQALLERAPDQALARVTALLLRAPTLAEARVLRGRAELRLGHTQAALGDLKPLLEAEAVAADPGALQDGGRAALGERDLVTALAFYRRLGGGAALLPERRRQVVAYIEVAAVLLVSQGASTDEALAYLREARRRSAGSGFSGLVSALSGYASLAQGREAEGQGMPADLPDPASLDRFEARKEVWLPDGLLAAVKQKLASRARAPGKR